MSERSLDADSGQVQAGPGEEYPCIECGDSFDAEFAMLQHHAREHPSKLPDRFWHHVDKGEPDECWEWQGATDGKSYGRFSIGGEKNDAHRVSMAINGEAPGDEFVLHHCDNPPCVNPNHLYLGGCSENLQDAYDRGQRDAVGEANPNAKLTEDEVEEIRERYDEETNVALADEFGVSPSLIAMINSGEVWGDD